MTFVYDKAGNRTLVIDNFGGVETSTYDDANQLTRRAYSDNEGNELARLVHVLRRGGGVLRIKPSWTEPRVPRRWLWSCNAAAEDIYAEGSAVVKDLNEDSVALAGRAVGVRRHVTGVQVTSARTFDADTTAALRKTHVDDRPIPTRCRRQAGGWRRGWLALDFVHEHVLHRQLGAIALPQPPRLLDSYGHAAHTTLHFRAVHVHTP